MALFAGLGGIRVTAPVLTAGYVAQLGSRARLALGSDRTIEAPGGSQALVRRSVVNVALTDGSTARVRPPTLVGALLGKVAAVTQIVSQLP